MPQTMSEKYIMGRAYPVQRSLDEAIYRQFARIMNRMARMEREQAVLEGRIADLERKSVSCFCSEGKRS